jgi:hypothetical protein
MIVLGRHRARTSIGASTIVTEVRMILLSLFRRVRGWYLQRGLYHLLPNPYLGLLVIERHLCISFDTKTCSVRTTRELITSSRMAAYEF